MGVKQRVADNNDVAITLEVGTWVIQSETGPTGFRIHFGFGECAHGVNRRSSNLRNCARSMGCYPCLHCDRSVVSSAGEGTIGLHCTW
jgi:hypothetical protein